VPPRGKPNAPPDTSVLLVWLAGGPPHLDMYDMKPDAPDEYRGPFKPVRTNVRGLDVCELMPLHSKCADKYTLIRSIAHTFNDHGGGSKRVMTGRVPNTPHGDGERLPRGLHGSSPRCGRISNSGCLTASQRWTTAWSGVRHLRSGCRLARPWVRPVHGGRRPEQAELPGEEHRRQRGDGPAPW
jgi:hypothetical protein